jgi:hypothetical protein
MRVLRHPEAGFRPVLAVQALYRSLLNWMTILANDVLPYGDRGCMYRTFLAVAVSPPVRKKLRAVRHLAVVLRSTPVCTGLARSASASLYEIRGNSVIILA